MSSPRPVWFHDPADFARLRESLAASSFTDRGVLQQLDIASITRLKDIGGEVIMERTENGSPTSTLIRLLLMGRILPPEAVVAALPRISLTSLFTSGLLNQVDRGIYSNFQVLPFLGVYLVVDKPRRTRMDATELPADYVMSVGGSTQTLANVTVRRPIDAMLDVGTGCGVHALLAAKHAKRVVAIDINPRAVDLAKFNARLNGLDNIDVRQGNMFEPVAGETFDLIVTNPPFVVSPENRFIYRDSTLPRDGVVEMVVRQGAPFLREGGYLQMLCNWCHLQGQDTNERLADWFRDSGCDAWAHQSTIVPPDHYAMSWIGHTQGGDPEAVQARFKEWMAYYAEQGITQLSMGMINMRKRAARSNWFKTDDFAERFTMLGPAGAHMERIFDAATYLHELSDDQLLKARLRSAPDARILHELAPREDGWNLIDSRIRLEAGLGFSATIDGHMSKLIMRCDGSTPLGTLIIEMARALEHDEAAVRESVLRLARGLIEKGFLLPPVN